MRNTHTTSQYSFWDDMYNTLGIDSMIGNLENIKNESYK